jgi:hypothetical protein
MNSALKSEKKDHQHALSHVSWLKGKKNHFWVITVNPGFASCYDPEEEVLVICDFI